MSSQADVQTTATNGVRAALGFGGLLSAILGILILVWPGKTAAVVALFIAIYVLTAGLIYIVLGIFSSEKSGWSRIGHIVLGVLFLIAGIGAILRPGVTAAFLATFIGLLVGILWIIEGIVSLSTLGDASSKGWTIFFAILSVVAGVVLLFSPFYGAALLWWLLGVWFIVLGDFQIARAFTFGKK